MKKWQDFIVFIIVYSVALLVGILVVGFIESTLWIKLLVFDLVMTLVVYIASLIVKNASIYDPFWSVIPPVLILYAMISLKAFGLVNLLMLFSISLWAIRLTYNWALNWHSFKYQDWRYDLIKSKTKKLYPLASLFAIQLLPTMVVFAQIYVSVKIIEANASLSLLAIIPSIIIIAATILQGVSDVQMKKFRESNTKKRVIDTGVWRYSRHPNYFAEILVWWGIYGFYIAIFGKIDLVILAPIIMTLLFLVVSIPLMENKILKTRPEYRQYQEKTSMLILLPNKKSK